MRYLTVVFAMCILLAISSCTQQSDENVNLENEDTRTEVFKSLVTNQDMLREFIQIIKEDSTAMMIFQADNQLMEMINTNESSSYSFSKKLNNISFEEAIIKVTEQLKTEGFGVLTQIDVKATLKKKLDVDFKNYMILGACNPPYAYKALQAENKIGTMLPCNVIVQEHEDGSIEVSAVDPIASMIAVDNSELAVVAKEIQSKLEKVINEL
jgi:uncharacterized protein (DUF302 family)